MCTLCFSLYNAPSYVWQCWGTAWWWLLFSPTRKQEKREVICASAFFPLLDYMKDMGGISENQGLYLAGLFLHIPGWLFCPLCGQKLVKYVLFVKSMKHK